MRPSNLVGRHGFAEKFDLICNEPVSTGNAGALARYEREARNGCSVAAAKTF